MNPAYNAAVWSSYLSAEVSASSALIGLIFVAVSINMSKIIAARALVARVAKAICALMTVLAAANFGLVPAQGNHALGAEIMAAGLVGWVFVSFTHYTSTVRNHHVGRMTRVLLTVFSQVISLQFIIAGASLWLMRGGGLYWLVGASIGSFIVALLDGWVLLIEIQR